MPLPAEPFPGQKQEERHQNQALHAGFQRADRGQKTAGAGYLPPFEAFVLHAERHARSGGQASGSVGHHGYAHVRRHPEVMRALHIRAVQADQQGKSRQHGNGRSGEDAQHGHAVGAPQKKIKEVDGPGEEEEHLRRAADGAHPRLVCLDAKRPRLERKEARHPEVGV